MTREAPPSNAPQWLPVVGLVVLVLVVFGPALAGAYVDDDLDLMTTSPAFRGLGHLGEAVTSPFWGRDLSYWRPLTSAVMGVGHWLGGGHPWPTHAAALLAHIVAAMLARRVLLELGCERRAAWLAAAVFAVLPCQVESVAWVAALGDPLAGMATLGCAASWLSWRRRAEGRLPGAAWAWFVAALAAKETGVVALLWLAAIELAGRRGVAPPRRRTASVGLAGIVALWYGARCLVFGDLAAGFDRGSMQLGLDGGTAVLLRVYLGSAFVVVPSGWLGVTPYRIVPPDAAGLLRALPWPLLGVACAVVAAFGARRWNARLAVVAGLGLLAGIAPVVLAPDRAGPWPLVDRYAYLGAFAYAALLVGAGATRAWLAAALLAVAVGTSAATVPHWRSQEAVVHAALFAAPQHPEPQAMAGHLAFAAAEAAGDPRQRADAYAVARSRFAAALYRLKEPWFAAAFLHRTIGFGARLGLALTDAYTRRLPARQALEAFGPLLQERPDDTAVLLAFGAAAASLDDARTAESAWKRALAVDPACDQAAFDLGRLYAMVGQRDAARRWLGEALRLRPDNAAAAELLRQVR